MVGGPGSGWEDCLDWQKCFGGPFHLSLTYGSKFAPLRYLV